MTELQQAFFQYLGTKRTWNSVVLKERAKYFYSNNKHLVKDREAELKVYTAFINTVVNSFIKDNLQYLPASSIQNMFIQVADTTIPEVLR